MTSGPLIGQISDCQCFGKHSCKVMLLLHEQLSAHSHWLTGVKIHLSACVRLAVKVFTSSNDEIFPVSASIVRCSFSFVIAAVCAAKLEVRGRHAGIWEVVPEQIAFGTFWRGSVSRAEPDVVVVELQETMDVCRPSTRLNYSSCLIHSNGSTLSPRLHGARTFPGSLQEPSTRS